MKLAAHHPFRSLEAKQEYLHFYDKKAEKWPIPSEAMMVETSFGQTFIRKQGPSDGPALVLLPGDTETSLSWLPVIEPLSKDYRTYAIDHIYDNGRSVYTKELTKPLDFIDWLDEVFNQLDLDRLNLVAYSYGAWQSVLYSLAHADRISHLILLAPSSTVLTPGPIMIARAITYYLLPYRFITKNYFYWYGQNAVKNVRTRAQVDEMIEEDLLARRSFKKRKFVFPSTLTDMEWKQLQIPTLFLIGENDRTYSAQRAVDRLRHVAPSVVPEIAPDTDHYLVKMRPAWVARRVLRFLQETAKSCETNAVSHNDHS